MDDLVNQLNARGRYRVEIRDEPGGEIWVEHVRAIHGEDTRAVVEALAEADIAATAVGPNALTYLYPTLARGLRQRHLRYGTRPLDIILAENLRNAAAIVRAGLQAHLPADFPLDLMVGLVETSIGKMVPIMTAAQRRDDPLAVFAEAYNQLILDGAAFKNPIPKVPGLSPKQHMAAYVDRKLFIHNLGHAAVAYLGFLADRQLTYIWQAVALPAVRAGAREAMEESARALLAAYPHEFTEQSLGEHIDDLLHRFANQALGDTIFRVGRDLPRKLSRDDRIIGALRFDLAHGIASAATARVAAAALEFRGTDEHGQLAPSDAAFLRDDYPQGLDHLLTHLCGLRLDDPAERSLADAIRAAHEELVVTASAQK